MPANNNQKLMINSEKGYVALFSTIILSAVFILLFIGMFVLAVGGMTRVAERGNFFKATSWANLCIEETLNAIRNNPNNLLNISYGEAGDGCEVLDRAEYGGGVIFFRVEGEFLDYKKTVEISVLVEEDDEKRTIKITSWEEGL